MSRSLNPNATQPGRPVQVTGAEATIPPRRNVLAAVIAIIVGSFVGIVALAAGLATFLDPLLRRKKASGEGSQRLIRVASVDAIPTDGTPVQVPVIADLTDAWNREASQPIGAVYLRREEAKI